MNFISSMLNATTVEPWITESFPIIRNVLLCIIAILAIGIIVLVLMQDTTSGGSNAITGQNESFYASNKGNTKEGRLKKYIVIAAISIAVISLLFFITYIIYPA